MKRHGFTLVELILAASIASVLAGLTAASYIAIQRLVVRGQDDLVAAQTARVIIDRVSRDLRQAETVVNLIPPDSASGLTTLEFEDGHEVDPAGPTYITYSLEGTTVRRNRHYYYLQSNPGQRLPYNAGVVGQGGFSVSEVTGENYLIADGVSDLRFYGSSSLVEIDTTITVNATTTPQSYHSAVAKRNQ